MKRKTKKFKTNKIERTFCRLNWNWFFILYWDFIAFQITQMMEYQVQNLALIHQVVFINLARYLIVIVLVLNTRADGGWRYIFISFFLAVLMMWEKRERERMNRSACQKIICHVILICGLFSKCVINGALQNNLIRLRRLKTEHHLLIFLTLL